MSLRLQRLTWVLIALCTALATWADTSSDPVGFYKLTMLGNSDTILSFPFSRASIAAMNVLTVTNDTLYVRSAPGWAVNQFVFSAGIQTNTYFVRFDSGIYEGKCFPIASNGNDSIRLTLGTNSISSLAYNDRLSIIPYWTLGSVFPGGAGVFVSPSSLNRPTEILFPDFNGTGVNLSAKAVYYFNSGIWKLVGGGVTSRNDDVIPLNSYIIVRHNVATNTTITALGSVALPRISASIRVIGTNRQDNYVSLSRPAPVSLDGSGLISSGAFASSPSVLVHTDELLVFDNAAVGKNKSAAGVYYFLNGNWRKQGSASTTVGTNQIFTPGTGVLIRKTTNSIAPVWINTPAY